MEHENDNVRVVDLSHGYYLVETPTKYVIYEDLYNEEFRIKRWKMSKDSITTISEAVKAWIISLN